ncbi:MAG: DAK2 domain-containing protein, partial [Clostridia bacterium]|nr:DAK2 domain-containing protein [Clostridia bacterium]
VKIENMSVQHTALPEEEKKTAEESTKTAERKKYGVVAVSNGSGISNVFREFGVDEIVEGGQTNNPSTGDFLEAYEKINAEHIFVLPNNGNMILAAEQSAEIYEKAKIHVIPAKNTGAGYVAVSSADLIGSESPEEIIETMLEAIGRIITGYVSPAIRDADINGVHITNGDTIGIIEKEIVISKPKKLDAIFGLAEKLLSADMKSMLTIFYGKDSSEEERNALSAYLEGNFPSVEFYFIEGNQEIAAYIFVAE